MNHEMQQRGQSDQITAVYWSVSHVALEGVIDQIRTRLVELVAEMRAEMPDESDVPTAAVADNAVNLIVHGKKANSRSTQPRPLALATPQPRQRHRWSIGARG
jgi:hypothetical protein